MNRFIALIISLAASLTASAQGEELSGNLMRSQLKIYVVVAVLVIIFAGITVFLFSLERRLKKLEENHTS
jgi:CcmD family protein